MKTCAIKEEIIVAESEATVSSLSEETCLKFLINMKLYS